MERITYYDLFQVAMMIGIIIFCWRAYWRVKELPSSMEQEYERLKCKTVEQEATIRSLDLRIMQIKYTHHKAQEDLKNKIAEQELIIYGIEEGAAEWKSKYLDERCKSIRLTQVGESQEYRIKSLQDHVKCLKAELSNKPKEA